ncbi:antitoxin [Micromonospora sp. NPDC048830]|uniref:antitoxin n=1 Tax=Micromonospora sp. NPDC048830 TaxID=3364257 RepID=UPI003723CB2D
MRDFMDKAEDFVDKHEKQVDEGLAKAGREADKRTGGRYREQIDKGVEAAQRRTGGGDAPPR